MAWTAASTQPTSATNTASPARVVRADLTAKKLAQQQLDSARGNEETKLPTGLQQPAAWSVEPPLAVADQYRPGFADS